MVWGTLGSKKSSKKRSKNGSLPKRRKGLAPATTRSVVMFTTAGPTRSTTSTVTVRRRKGSLPAALPASRSEPGGREREQARIQTHLPAHGLTRRPHAPGFPCDAQTPSATLARNARSDGSAVPGLGSRRLRAPFRPPARARGARSRPREPDRRAHRLQRRLGAALRDRPRHASCSRRGATTGACASIPARAAKRYEIDPAAPGSGGATGSTTCRAWCSRCGERGHRRARPRSGGRERGAAGVRPLELGGALRRARHGRRSRAGPRPRRGRAARASPTAPRTDSWASPAGSWIRSRARWAGAITRCASTAAAPRRRWCRSRPQRLAWLVAHSGVERRLARGGYGDRVAECRQRLRGGRRRGPRAARRARAARPRARRSAGPRAPARAACCSAARAT